MYSLEYIKFSEVDPDHLLPLLNKQTTRAHLIDHALFDLATVRLWMQEKLALDATPGCKVRAILADKTLAGWCGIQLEQGAYELAIVIDDKYWGIGTSVFADMMVWAKALGHASIRIHLLHTRREYKFLHKMAKRVYESKLLGRRFTSYELEVK